MQDDAGDSDLTSTALLGLNDPYPVVFENSGAAGDVLVVGDHAGRLIPRALGDLGLSPEELDRHIAWDIGAAGVGSALARRLNACFIRQRYSRLVIDCNRDPGRSDSIVEIGDGARVPGNAGLSSSEREARREAIFAPYHDAIRRELDGRAVAGLPTIIVSVHSFTPVMAGFERPWRHGILHQNDSPFSLAMLEELRAVSDVPVGDNEPYAMDDVDFTIPFHAGGRGLDYVEIEIRQDLIVDPQGQAAQAEFLAPLIVKALGRL